MISTNTPITRTLHLRFPPPPPPFIISRFRFDIKMPYEHIGSQKMFVSLSRLTLESTLCQCISASNLAIYKCCTLMDRIVPFLFLLLLLLTRNQGRKRGKKTTPYSVFARVNLSLPFDYSIQLARSISRLRHVFSSHGGPKLRDAYQAMIGSIAWASFYVLVGYIWFVCKPALFAILLGGIKHFRTKISSLIFLNKKNMYM